MWRWFRDGGNAPSYQQKVRHNWQDYYLHHLQPQLLTLFDITVEHRQIYRLFTECVELELVVEKFEVIEKSTLHQCWIV